MRKKEILRCVVPALGLVLLAIFAALYAAYPRAYYQSLIAIGVPVFKYPFVDWEYIGTSIKCWKEGINVYITNPCDVLGHPEMYSPLWLRLVFIPTGRAWTMPIGIGLILAFLLSLFWVVKPTSLRELILFTLTCTSTMVVFALERGNVDLIMFMMLVVAGVLGTGPLANRILAYALMLLAGLLKFYPLIALSTALCERPRTFFAIAATTGLVVVGFIYRLREELAAISANIPRGGFGARNLLFDGPGFALQVFPRLGQVAWFTALPYAIMAVLLVVTAVQVFYLARDRNFASAFGKLPERDALFLVIGAAVIGGCFFAGQSIGYRGVHLIFVVAGLIAMRRVADDAATRATLRWALMIIVFLMWEGLVREALLKLRGPEGLALSALFWLIREVLWWRLAALLLGVLAIFGVNSELFIALRQWRGTAQIQSHR